jgi:hypothetical protein|tara:strand:- start:1559 stop:1960 length:402 start_codon:yes stop_codon:yes gene_type:complete
MKSRIEMKTQKHCLFTKKRGTLKENTAPIKLMNSLGDASERTKEETLRFDYLLIVDTGNEKSYAAAIIAKKDIRPEWLDFKKDGVTLQMPTAALEFIRVPSEINIKDIDTSTCSPYKDFKNEAQRDFLAQFQL